MRELEIHETNALAVIVVIIAFTFLITQIIGACVATELAYIEAGYTKQSLPGVAGTTWVKP